MARTRSTMRLAFQLAVLRGELTPEAPREEETAWQRWQAQVQARNSSFAVRRMQLARLDRLEELMNASRQGADEASREARRTGGRTTDTSIDKNRI